MYPANVEFYDSYGQKGELIFKATTTCYKSEEKTSKTADDFIKMHIKNGHTAMLEFMWIPIIIEIKDSAFDYTDFFWSIKEYSNYLEVKKIKGKDLILISGNARAWRDFLLFISENNYKKIVIETLIEELRNFNPVLFSFENALDWEKTKTNLRVKEKICNIKILTSREEIVQFSNKSTNDWYNDWFMVKITGASTGFTHEVVRHRTMSFAQASTRYINLENFEFVFPERFIESEEERTIVNNKLLPTIEQLRQVYGELINAGMKRDLVRQLLPKGIATEICVAGRISDWVKFFNLRVSSRAHWEIREVATQIYNYFKINSIYLPYQ